VTLVIKFSLLAKRCLVKAAGAAELLQDVAKKQLRGAQPNGLMVSLDLLFGIWLPWCQVVLHAALIVALSLE
jgi:hypothetical protein